MALWQFEIFMLPEEEINSFFQNHSRIRPEDFSEISWWKYRKLSIEDFDVFTSSLSREKSWTHDVIQYGNLDSDCVELTVENNTIEEVRIRMNINDPANPLIDTVSKFCISHNCVLIDREMNIIDPAKYNLQIAFDKYRNTASNMFD
jgi:hypothetical protein